ncbi:MAG: hypothetical protein ABS75_26075 [Pelagibacterium sp. SCN 63-23]|nr:MAG: hypothetical protein ABS75_26075 [Pelagibacterium sp. SCN 63-23]
MTELNVEGLEVELRSLLLNGFDYDFAWLLGSRLRDAAVELGAPVAIEVRHGPDVVFATLVPGATIDNFDWTRRKCAVAYRFHKSSLAVRLEAQGANYDFNARFRLPPAEYAASGGGFPLILNGGTLVGSVGVSGLPDIEDHMLITSTLRTLVGTQS